MQKQFFSLYYSLVRIQIFSPEKIEKSLSNEGYYFLTKNPMNTLTNPPSDELIAERLRTLRKHVSSSGVARLCSIMDSNKRLLLLDLEVNSPGEWERSNPETDDIIQIGAVLLDSNLNELDSICIYVQTRNKPLSEHIIELTGITEHDLLEKGVSFPKAYQSLMNLYDKNTIIAAYGMYDSKHLTASIQRYNLPFPSPTWQEEYINVKSPIASLLKPERRSLQYAIELLWIESTGRAHDALVDAKDTAAVLRKLFSSYISRMH